MERLPQKLVNVRVRDRGAARARRRGMARDRGGGASGSPARGRMLVRPSGTEPLVRVMAEAVSHDECDAACERIVRVIEEQLG